MGTSTSEARSSSHWLRLSSQIRTKCSPSMIGDPTPEGALMLAGCRRNAGARCPGRPPPHRLTPATCCPRHGTGIHQDGYSVVGIFCAGRRRIRGAATSLYRHPKDPEPLITKVRRPPRRVRSSSSRRSSAPLHRVTLPAPSECSEQTEAAVEGALTRTLPACCCGPQVLQPGQALIANDKAVYHFTGLVEPEGESEGARRTRRALSQSRYMIDLLSPPSLLITYWRLSSGRSSRSCSAVAGTRDVFVLVLA